MSIIYPVIFTATHDSKNTYLVYIHDLNGGVTEGYGLSDAIKMARDYIGNALYDKEDSNIPKASEKIDISQSVYYNDFPKDDFVISYVDVDIDAFRKSLNTKAVRRNVSIPAWLDKKAAEANINVSRVLQEALIEKLNA